MSKPNRKLKCECPKTGRNPIGSGLEDLYDPINELPFVQHEPHKCKCTNDIQPYEQEDGTILNLCSCCC